MLPGATAVQLAIFLGYARGGWWGGLIGGLCFVLPAFFVMLVLTMTYAAFGVSPLMRGALYGLGPVVLGVFAVGVYRLGRSAMSGVPQALIATVAAVISITTPLGIAATLILAGGAGLLLFHPRNRLTLAAASVAASLALLPPTGWVTPLAASGRTGPIPSPHSLVDIGTYFFKVGAFILGGGLTMIAFIQDQVVGEFHWLTPREFIDGLALGQFTPGPVLIVAAYVGYKVAGFAGATVAATATFLPSFILMLATVPILDRVRKLAWTRAMMRGMGPAVIGILTVSLIRLAPHALPNPFAIAIMVATVVGLLVWRIGVLKLVMAGALLGLLQSRIPIPGFKAVERLVTWATV